jgi:hypothetical protein
VPHEQRSTFRASAGPVPPRPARPPLAAAAETTDALLVHAEAPQAISEPQSTTSQAAASPAPGLESEQVAAVVFEARDAFQACAGQPPGVPGRGRRVSLSFTVTPAGSVASPALDDPLLRETPFGRCLLDAGRRLVFPVFRGEPLPVSVPIVFSVPGS